MNAATQTPPARSQNAEDLFLLTRRIRATERFLRRLRRQRNCLLDQIDADFPARLDPAAQERALEDILSAPGPLDEKLALGMRIVHEPPDQAIDPDPDFVQRVADEAREEAAETRSQVKHICEHLPDGSYRLDCHECRKEFVSPLPTAHCPDCLDQFTDSNGNA